MNVYLDAWESSAHRHATRGRGTRQAARRWEGRGPET